MSHQPRLTNAERYVLRSLHANTREYREVREKLADGGLRYCPGCDSCLPFEHFGRAHESSGMEYNARCRTCCAGPYRRKPFTLRDTYVRTTAQDAAKDREGHHARYKRKAAERQRARQ
jgi:hypothetical protein